MTSRNRASHGLALLGVLTGITFATLPALGSTWSTESLCQYDAPSASIKCGGSSAIPHGDVATDLVGRQHAVAVGTDAGGSRDVVHVAFKITTTSASSMYGVCANRKCDFLMYMKRVFVAPYYYVWLTPEVITYAPTDLEKGISDFSIAMVNNQPNIFFQIAFKQSGVEYRRVRLAQRRTTPEVDGCFPQPGESGYWNCQSQEAWDNYLPDSWFGAGIDSLGHFVYQTPNGYGAEKIDFGGPTPLTSCHGSVSIDGSSATGLSFVGCGEGMQWYYGGTSGYLSGAAPPSQCINGICSTPRWSRTKLYVDGNAQPWGYMVMGNRYWAQSAPLSNTWHASSYTSHWPAGEVGLRLTSFSPHVTWGDSSGVYDSTLSFFSGWVATPIDTTHPVGMVSSAPRYGANSNYGVAIYSVTGSNAGPTLKFAVESP